MKVAYVDTSALVSIVFGEPGATATVRQLEAFDELFSSNLLEAELVASLARERVPLALDFLNGMSWVLPDRRLTDGEHILCASLRQVGRSAGPRG